MLKLLRKNKWGQTVCWFLVFLLLFSVGSTVRSPAGTVKTDPAHWTNPYADVPEEKWSYTYITDLNKAGILPDAPAFEPARNATRGEIVSYLYRMDQSLFPEQHKERAKAQKKMKKPDFQDVDKKSELYDAVCWAAQSGIANGISETEFAPDLEISRAQMCTIASRFAALNEMKIPAEVKPDQFVDSLRIPSYARSSVTACEMAGLITGFADGYFYAEEPLTRQECAAILHRLMTAAQTPAAEGVQTVDFSEGAYDNLYAAYQDIPFRALVPEGEEVPAEFFDKAVFIGDSVSVMLQSYAGSTGALGQAKFLCAGSMSATSILSGKLLPEWPIGSGEKPPIQDSVADTGAQIVYVMLGMNNLNYGLNRTLSDMQTMLQNIKVKCPEIQIIVESMTPMADSSTSFSSVLNNDVIHQYNMQMLEICQDNKWYFVNVAETLKDETGYLRKSYCSDYGKMGMHFTNAGCEAWVAYLKTHVPEALL